jgi:cell division protease FtsH
MSTGAEPSASDSRINWRVLLLLGLIAGGIWLLFEAGSGSGRELDYSTFRQRIAQNRVASVTLTGREVEGMLRPAAQPERAPAGEQAGAEEGTGTEQSEPEPAERAAGEKPAEAQPRFHTRVPAFGVDELLAELEAAGVRIDVESQSSGGGWLVLGLLLPFLLLGGLFWFATRAARERGQGMLSIRKNRAQLYERRQEQTTFADVAGSEAAKADLHEIVAFLRQPDRFERLGGKAPHGLMLLGPPGTGKTLLARAVAGEAEAPFFSITGSDFMEMFVGVGASRVRSMFEEAKRVAPAIVFIDEIDSIGRRRGAGLGGGHDEREQTLNQLLSELDGFEPNQDVIVMAATNRPDILDPALMRPGRFDRRVTVELPSVEERVAILEIHARDKALDDPKLLRDIARSTPGFSGADLENLLNEAALLASRRDAERIERTDVEAARDKLLMGHQRRNLALSEQERRRIAFHEAGHALVAAVHERAEPVHKVSIMPRGRAMGATQQLPERDRTMLARGELDARLSVQLAGRAAEQIGLGELSTGAEDDLRQASELGRRMVESWGMSERFGHMAFGDGREPVFLGEELGRSRRHAEQTAREIDAAIQSLLDEAHRFALEALQHHRHLLERLVAELLEHEEISGQRIDQLLRGDSAAGGSVRPA